MRTEPEAGLAVPTRLAEIAEVELTRADQAMRQNQDFAIGAVRIKDVLTPLTLQAQQTRIAMRMRLRKAFESICQFRCSDTTCHSFLSRSSNLALATRSAEHTSELQSVIRISYAVFCFKKQN